MGVLRDCSGGFLPSERDCNRVYGWSEDINTQDMKNQTDHVWLIPGMDLMTNLAIMFIVLFAISLASVTKKQSSPTITNLTNHNLYVIKVQWPGSSHDDVDSYTQDPIGNIVYFRNLSTPTITLERDDTGMDSNTAKLPSGETVTSAFNEEVTDIRSIIPGEYIFNVQMYSKRDDKPCPVSVSLFKCSGSDWVLVTDASVVMTEKGQEYTAFRFTLTKDGEVVDINNIPIKFVK